MKERARSVLFMLKIALTFFHYRESRAWCQARGDQTRSFIGSEKGMTRELP
jgi:hypothetical protein